MSAYALGVDLGTTYSAAAVARGGAAEPLSLGADAAQIPSVVLIRDDGEILVGDAAERRSGVEPTNTAREFKRRLGDPVPIVIGGVAHSVESLMGHVLRWIVAKATEQEGEPPTVVVLTHPANYFGYKIGALREAARLAGIAPERIVLLTEPEAAAIAYARQQKIEPGEIVAVYDFGGGTFDAALVRRTGDQFAIIGVPEGMERLGGIDFDQAVMAHVDDMLGGRIAAADMNDPQTLAGMSRLRSECRRAKEALSVDTDTAIPVALPGVQTDIRLTRNEFEAMVRPRIGETVQSLERAVVSAGVGMDQVARVLLVGGTSRIPIVAENVRRATGRPVGLDAHPKLAIAVGASLAGAASIPATDAPASPAWRPPASSASQTAAVGFQAAQVPNRAARRGPGRRRRLVAGAVGIGVGGAGVVAFLTLRDGPEPQRVAVRPTTAANADTSSAPAVTTVSASSAGSATSATSEPPASSVAGRGVTGPVDLVAFGTAPAGSGIPGPARNAGVSGIAALGVDARGDVYVATSDGLVLRITGDTVEALAQIDPSDGSPGGIAVAVDGSVVVSTTAGVRSFLDGESTVLIDAAAAGLGSTPGPVAFDGAGNLYLADNDTHRIIRRQVDGTLSLVAGTGVAAQPGPVVGDGQKAGTVALGTVMGLAVDGVGNILVADGGVLAVRVISPAGTVTTLAGGGATPLGSGGVFVTDGTSAHDISFGSINGLAVDARGSVYVSDATSGAIVRIGADGQVDIVIAERQVGSAPNSVPANESEVVQAGLVTFDRFGSLYFQDGVTVRRISGL